MNTLATATAHLFIGAMEPTSYSQLYTTNEMNLMDNNPVVREKRLENNSFTNRKSYIDDISIVSNSKLLIDPIDTLAESIKYTTLIKTLKSYVELEEDWDGYGGIVPDGKIIVTAIELLEQMKDAKLQAPKSMLSGSGEVGLYWKNNSMYIEISIDEPMNYSLYIEEGNAYSGKADISIANDLMPELFVAMDKFKIV